ncbi:aminoacetone oxidase family FAD-binding enzyme [Lewinella sp. JB7]|uniref:aminoacetone oxidase family FAD-binding enzyme n=1 Tax=Lewinella sp. JB7 TaxID=2962887 RepID=UPI0020C99AF9|nr:aminoacetone oxidase family FAD-binding enzyme [Lewinella sp. JB7]MCP9236368.1 aminoacetone oxidase family FAD-binding enzyme [Lewinella sp. JB7]
MALRTVVLGGGAAGFFAAIRIAARHPDWEVSILERGRSVLEKVRISGGGRCNVTHACWDPAELVRYYPRGEKELLGPFHKFACGDTMAWFGDRGVALKIEEDGRVFPESDSSQTIIDCLWAEAKRLGIRIVTGARVESFTAPASPPEPWAVTVGGSTYYADRLVVTTGSNPAVWKLLRGIGHQLIDPVPSLFALNIKDTRLAGLSGISLPWVQLRAGRLQADGPLLITHRGLSGPAVLRLSAWGARELHPLGYDFELFVNWVARRPADVETALAGTNLARKQVAKNSQLGLPARLWYTLVIAAGIAADQQWAHVTSDQRAALITELTAGRFRVKGKATNKDEFTTAGGVDLREVDFRSFQSKVHPTLYLAGEVLDIDAITGGFNFQAAWTGGWLIGEHIQ